MANPILNWLKQYLNFSKKDRNATLILAALIFLVLIGHIIVNNIQPESNLNIAEVEYAIKEWNAIQKQELGSKRLFNFDPNTILETKLDSLAIPESIKRNIIRYRAAGGKFMNQNDVRKIYGMNDSIFSVIKDYIIILGKENSISRTTSKIDVKSEKRYSGYFDPNNAVKDLLIDFGFNNYQAENLIKYRELVGRIDFPDELLKVYGVDTTFFLTIKDYIRIDKQVDKNETLTAPAKIVVELNAADTAQLLNLTGIGPVFSMRIISFRELLGGFYSKKQLLEVYNLPEETYNRIKDNISVDSTLLRKIRINFADYNELVRHPYFKKEQVRNIIEWREDQGQFNSVNELYECGVLSKDEFERIKPYLTCR